MSSVLVPEVEFNSPAEYAKLQIGWEVNVSTDSSGASPGWGVICGIDGECAHIWFASVGRSGECYQGHLIECWLRDDPRVKRMPHLINPQDRRGIFWLSDRQIKANAQSEQIATLTEVLENMVVREKGMKATLDELTAEVKKLQTQLKAK